MRSPRLLPGPVLALRCFAASPPLSCIAAASSSRCSGGRECAPPCAQVCVLVHLFKDSVQDCAVLDLCLRARQLHSPTPPTTREVPRPCVACLQHCSRRLASFTAWCASFDASSPLPPPLPPQLPPLPPLPPLPLPPLPRRNSQQPEPHRALTVQWFAGAGRKAPAQQVRAHPLHRRSTGAGRRRATPLWPVVGACSRSAADASWQRCLLRCLES